MEISKYLRQYARTIKGKQQLIIDAYARALEVIPRQLCDNAGFDSTDILNKLRMRHARGETWAGADIQTEGIADTSEKFVWEPALVKINAIKSATEAATMIVSIDNTTMAQSLGTLVQKRQITNETAIGASSLRDELEQMIARGAGVVAGAGMARRS